MFPRVITLCPDYGSPWGLWSDAPLTPAHLGEHLTPEHFHLSDTLKSQLNYWLDNYADAPEEESHTWKGGFDTHAWAQEGDVISAALEKEVPGSTVTRDYLIYLDSPTRSS